MPLRNGLTKPSKVRGSGIPMVNMKEIFAYNKIYDDTPMELVPVTEKELENTSLEFGDLLFARQSLTEEGAGKVCIYNGHQTKVFESHLIRCRLDQSRFNSDYFYYFFSSSTGKALVSTIVQQTAAAGIRGSDLQELEIPVPPLPEQKAIASVLTSLDDKIDLLHRQNKTLEAMAETLFRQWFIEEAKEDWEEVQLKELVFVIDNRGKTPPYLEEATYHPIIEVNALTKNGRAIDYSVIRKYVTKETFDTWFRQYLEPLDIVLSTVGSIGSFGMFFGGGGCVAQNIIGLRAQKKISNFFLYQWLVANTDEIKELDIGSVQPSIKVPHLLSLSVKIPMAEKLELFDTQVEAWVRKILANTKQIQTLENLRDTLLPKLMSGEVRVQYQTEEVA